MQRCNPHRHAGFTLTEVLVALMVLSVGLLGVGKLVLFSARSNDSAYLRSQATELAYSVLDDMRVNRQSALNTWYNVAHANTLADPGFLCTQASPCSSGTQLAQYDLFQWWTRLSAGLGPSADGSVNVVNVIDPFSGTTVFSATITVTWDDSVAGQTFDGVAGNRTITLQTIL